MCLSASLPGLLSWEAESIPALSAAGSIPASSASRNQNSAYGKAWSNASWAAAADKASVVELTTPLADAQP